jgi:hypothetical protein
LYGYNNDIEKSFKTRKTKKNVKTLQSTAVEATVSSMQVNKAHFLSFLNSRQGIF